MIKKFFMWLLNLFFRQKEEMIPLKGDIRRILIIRTDERLGEIILTLPLINHLRRVYDSAKISFLMCKKYEELFKYINCDELISFEKRDFFGLFAFIVNLRRIHYDLIVLGGKIAPPSLTSYLLLGLARGKYKAAIRQKDFNPFANLLIDIDTESEPFSKSELAEKITGKRLSFDNSLKISEVSYKNYDVMIFTDSRKVDHQIPVKTFSDIVRAIKDFDRGLRVLVVSGRETIDRINALKREVSIDLEFSYSPPLDELIRLITKSKAVIVGNTGVMHLSVALGVPTCAIFTRTSPDVWGYPFEPHLMVDAQGKPVDINVVVNFVKSSINKSQEVC